VRGRSRSRAARPEPTPLLLRGIRRQWIAPVPAEEEVRERQDDRRRNAYSRCCAKPYNESGDERGHAERDKGRDQQSRHEHDDKPRLRRLGPQRGRPQPEASERKAEADSRADTERSTVADYPATLPLRRHSRTLAQVSPVVPRLSVAAERGHNDHKQQETDEQYDKSMPPRYPNEHAPLCPVKKARAPSGSFSNRRCTRCR
jgi:hypothetical protein